METQLHDSVLPTPLRPTEVEATSHLAAPTSRLGRLFERGLEFVGPIAIHRAAISLLFRSAGLVESSVSVPTGRVHVWSAAPRKADRRPTLLLLHGFGADAEQQWAPQVRALSRHYRLVVPDLFYFGGSWPVRRSVHLDAQVEMCLSLADALRVDSFHVLGISYGGFVAYELAACHPERVGKLIVSNCPGPLLTEDDHAAMLARLGVSEMSDLLVPSHPRSVRQLLAIAHHRPPSVPDVACRDAFRCFFRQHREERRAIMRGLTARIGEPELLTRHVDKDSLILWGEHDKVFSPDLAQRLTRSIPGARLHVIPDTAHAPNQERGGEYNRVVRGFLG